MARLLLAMIAGVASLLAGAVSHGTASPARHANATMSVDVAQPPIADPQLLVGAYYQALAAAVNSGDFGAMTSFFTPDAGIDSDLVPGGAGGTAQILPFFKKL